MVLGMGAFERVGFTCHAGAVGALSITGRKRVADRRVACKVAPIEGMQTLLLITFCTELGIKAKQQTLPTSHQSYRSPPRSQYPSPCAQTHSH
jgi:hypothetical protein